MTSRLDFGHDFFALIRRSLQLPRSPWPGRRGAHSFEVLECRIAPAAVLTATKVDIFTDADGDGKAEPGETITYRIVITNTGDATALNVTLEDLLDPHTTLVNGSVNVSPLAINDTYTTVSNTALTAGNISFSGAGAVNALKVTDNDREFLGDTFSVSAFDATSVGGGKVSMVTAGADMGSFSYHPAAGFLGTDTFNYTVRDKGPDGIAGNADDLSTVGTVSISVLDANGAAAGTPKVWYVDNAYAGANGASIGTSARPFTSLADVSNTAGPDVAGDIIYLHTGAARYGGGIQLLANQTLWGENEALILNGQTLRAAGTDPVIENLSAGGNGVVLASGNTLKGFTVGDVPNGFDILNVGGALGSSVGNLKVSNVNCIGTGGVFVVGNGGVLDVTLDSAITTGGGTGVGIALTLASGNFNVTSGSLSGVAGNVFSIFSGSVSVNYTGTISTVSAYAVTIASHSTGTINLNGDVTSNGGFGLFFSNDSDTINLNGNKTINTGSRAALTLLNNPGATINFLNGGLNIDTTSGTAVDISGPGTLNISGAGNTIDSTSGTAFRVATGNAGTVTVNSNAALTSTAGRLVDIQGHTAGNITLSGPLSNGGTGILISGNSGGAITFSGATKTLNTGANNAVNLTSNTGATIDFTGGGLALTTTSGIGFNAMGGGTVSVTGSGNSVASNGTAINVVNTAIGAGGLNFQSITGTVNTPPLLFAPAPGDTTLAPATADHVPTPAPGLPPTSATTAAASTPVIVDDGVLSQAELDSLVAAAIARWEATGLTPEQSALLQQVVLTVTDLPGWSLGEAAPGHVILDANAAGNAWFIDSTPKDDAEFGGAAGATRLAANSTGGAQGRIDALTTVLHELGHQLGLDDSYGKTDGASVMHGFLGQGERRLPGAHQAEGAQPHLGGATQPDFLFAPVTIGDLPAGRSVTVVFQARVDDPMPSATVFNQATVKSTGLADVLTDDPDVAGGANPTVTPIDLPDVSVSAAPGALLEDSGGLFTYTFTRSGDLSQALVVSFTFGGTASSLSDYTVTGGTDPFSFNASTGTGTIALAAGAATAMLSVSPTADTLGEPDETVTLLLLPGSFYEVAAPSSASGTILADDTDISVNLTPASVLEDGATNLVYTFTRVGVTAGALDVSFSVTGTALFSAADFAISNSPGALNFNPADGTGVLHFAAGQSTLVMTVDPLADTTVESDENVIVAPTAGSGYRVVGGSQTGTIVNDDAVVSLSIAPASATEDGTGSLVYTFTRTGYTAGPLTVNFGVGGTAAPSTDYFAPLAKSFTSTAGTIAFAPGASTAILTIDPLNDPTIETDETVILTLAAGTSYSVGTAGGITGTILNDDGNSPLAFSQFVDPHPATGNQFGATVVPLSTGNVVITAPGDDAAGSNAGAVYLFNGTTGALISTLYGSHVNDQIGTKVTALANGNFVISSPSWDSSAATDVGAATWASGITGISGTISIGNSLVGSTADDHVGGVVTALPNGNYVVASDNWHISSSLAYAGAVTWGNGATGISGAISSANSLIGAADYEIIGNGGVTVLPSGNFLIRSTAWNNGDGAITWVNGATGLTGFISASNSLVGAPGHGDHIGDQIIVLTNGNYVVTSYGWQNVSVNLAGAVTWGSGTTGVSGVVSAANSLVGSQYDDRLGSGGVTALSNGNYVVKSPAWNYGAILDAGAATWGNGATGTTGVVGIGNSLVGGTANDGIGGAVVALTNGNYVVSSSAWHNGALSFAGAVTWADGATGITGLVSTSNSLVGTQTNDQVGSGQVVPLANGNYVVGSLVWQNSSSVKVGAATWANGATGLVGTVNASNSLVGSTSLDQVGHVVALTNGNYVAYSPFWDNGAAADAGALTWGNGASGVVGVLGSANSLVGSVASDKVGSGDVTPLRNGQFVAASPLWNNGAVADAGAATWGSGVAAITGTLSSANSLVGSVANDKIGLDGVQALPNGNYLVVSTARVNGAAGTAGAVTWGNGATGLTGTISPGNSFLGSTVADQVGSGGVTLLSNGNYVVLSPLWNNGALADVGAVTWGDGATGGRGIITTANSAAGAAATAGLTTLVVDEGKDWFHARFLTDGSGRVRLGSQASGFLSELNVQLLAGTSVAEDGAGNLVYTFSRAANSDAALTVSFNVAGTAGFNTDYTVLGAASFTSTTGTVSFAAGAATATVTIDPIVDTVVESNETAILTLTSGSNYVLSSPTAATGTINNDDADIAVTLTTGTASEDGTPNLVYTFTRTGSTSGTHIVNFSLAGTASASSDYAVGGTGVAFNAATGIGTLSFTAGQTSLQVTVNPTADNVVETDETAVLNATGGTSYNVSGGPLTGTITNDDADVKIQLLSASSVVEDGAGNLVYTLTRTGFLGSALTVNLGVTGTAALTGDYTHNFASYNSATGAATVTFAANQSTATVTIDPTTDSILETDESVILTLAANGAPATTGGYTVGTPGAATGTILNDDLLVSVSVGAASTAENGAPLIYTFTRGGNPSAPMTVNFSVGGTARFTGDTDFVADYSQSGAASFSNTAGSVTFPAGSATATVTLTPNDDTSVEGTESVVLTVSSGPGYGPHPTQGSASAILTDNDTANLQFTGFTGVLNVDENGASQNLPVTLQVVGNGVPGTGRLERVVGVSVQDLLSGTATPGAASDYTLSNTLLTFGSGSMSGSQTFGLAVVNDRSVEGIESINLALGSLSDGTGGQVTLAAATSRSLNVVDDDFATIGFVTSSSAVAEGAGTLALSAVLTISGTGTGPAMLAREVTFNVTTTGGLATAGIDYSLPAVQSFTSGALTGATKPAMLGLVGDRVVEGDEDVNLALALGSDGTGGQVTIASAAATHTTTIQDDDNAMVRYLVSSSTVSEGTSSLVLDFRLDFSVPGTGPIFIERAMSFAVTTTGGTALHGADYDLPLTSLTYSAGSGNGATRTASLAITNDAIVEGDETINLGLMVVSDGNGGHAHMATGGFELHTVTITDNDSATVGFVDAGGPVGEGSGPAPLAYALTITANGAGTPTLGRNVTFNTTARGGTATSGVDFALPGVLTFAAGSVHGATVDANLALTNDAIVEGTETVMLGLSLATDGTGTQVAIATGAAATHLTTISDDDTAQIGFTTASSSVGESEGSDTIGLTMTITPGAGSIGAPALGRDVTVVPGTLVGGLATGGVDYTLPSVVTFPANGNLTQVAAVGIVDDQAVEGDELASFGLSLGADGTGGLVTIKSTAATHATYIQDNDNALVRYLVSSSTVSEGTSSLVLDFRLDFSVSGTGPISLERDMTFAVTNSGGPGGASSDFDLPLGSITYTAGSGNGATRSATLAITNDAIVEGAETFELGLAVVSDGNGGRAHIATGGSELHTVTITDNDTATIGFVDAAGTVSEASGHAPLAYRLTIRADGAGTPTLGREVMFNTTATGGTATNGADFGLPGLLTFASGSVTGATVEASLAVINDAIVERTEAAFLGLALGTDDVGGQVSIAAGAASRSITITDDDTATVTLSGGVVQAESHSGVTIHTFTATLDHDVQGGFVVAYTTADGSATLADQDFAASEGVLTFEGLAGEEKTFTVLVTGDTKFENDEAFTVALGALSGAPAGVNVNGAPQTVTITNDDLVPTISIADQNVMEGTPGGATSLAVFTVTLSNPSYLPVTVDFATADGTAIAPGDYTALPHSTLTIAPGETTGTITVGIRPDALFEAGANETFLVKLSHPGNAALGSTQAVGTILHDDGVPSFHVLDAQHSFTFFDRNHDKVTLKLTGPGTGTLLLEGGAVDGADLSEIALAGTSAKSALSVTVTKDKKTGDGLVRLGELTVQGALASFSGPAVDFTTGGLRATEAVLAITAHSLVGEVVTGGAAANKLALTFGELGAGGAAFAITTPQTISALKATSIGSGRIDAAAIGSISVTAGPLAADIMSAGAIGSIAVKGGGVSGDLAAARFGAVTITGGGFSGSLTSLTAPGVPNALTSLSITGGDLTGSVNLAAASGAITVKGGTLSGDLQAASFGAVSVTGGEFSGSLTSLTPRATLGTAKALTSLTVTDGNLTGDIRLLGASGAITVTSKPALARGNLDGASIVASALASLTVGRDFISSIVLAGADLGADHAFGGDSDTFAAGSIGAVKIGRHVRGTGSIIGAGFQTLDAHLKDTNDTIIGGVASIIASLTVTGTAAPESYFAAGRFQTSPKLGGLVVTPAGDERFKVG